MDTTIVPAARRPIRVRVATPADVPFMDGLQKAQHKALGYFPTQQFEGYVRLGAALIAHDPDPPHAALGYVIARDRYLKRDELGVIYQLCVAPGDQRKLIGASLVQSVFERAAYGCRLFCCWCAQDLDANYFWESLGFVPIAFRAGSTGKKRLHIFWQRRVVEGDATPWWYPFQTNGGAIREDRLVFPIPPGTHWKDVRAVELPKREGADGELLVAEPVAHAGDRRRPSRPAKPTPAVSRVAAITPGGLRFGTPEPTPAKAKATGAPKPRVKNDPRLAAGVRELRDRYLEQVNREGVQLLPGPAKYDVSRALGGASVPIHRKGIESLAPLALPAPAYPSRAA